MGLFAKLAENKPSDAGHAVASSPPAAAPAAAARSTLTTVGGKTSIKGEISGDEDIVVEGVVEGSIRVSREVRVAPTGSVRANVEARSIVVSGEMVGDCAATGRVEIQATGRLSGNIKAPRIVIAEGAVFRGTSDMSAGRAEAEGVQAPPAPGGAK